MKTAYCYSKRILIPDHNARPERWESPPEAISENPGVWSNLMTFLGGSRACIGYQFTLIEFVPHLLRILHVSFAKVLIYFTSAE